MQGHQDASHDADAADAATFAQLYPAVYLRFHRRDAKGRALPAASRAVLQHLSVAGPLTVGEMARHLGRAQSVVSEVVDHLARDGLLERMRDQRDRRRVLVWLTEDAVALLDRDRDVLSRELLARAMARMTPAERRALLQGMSALIRADGEVNDAAPLPTHGRTQTNRNRRKRP